MPITQQQLNWDKSSIHDIRAALELMEDYSEQTWRMFVMESLVQCKEPLVDGKPPQSGAIYGALAGMHRYFIQPNGNIAFSAWHAVSTQASRNAEELGFEMLR